jgi:hypothetical protein
MTVGKCYATVSYTMLFPSKFVARAHLHTARTGTIRVQFSYHVLIIRT